MELQKLWVALGLKAQEYTKGLQDAHKQAQTFASQVQTGLNNTFASIRKVGTAAFLGVGIAAAAGFGLAAREAINMNASLETSELQFTTLMGSSDKAKEHVASLFEFAAKTPFETEPIIAASKHLQVFGGEALNSMENLTLVGDAAAALGVPFDEAAFWVGRLYSNLQGGQPFGEAAMRLQEMGIMAPAARQELEKMQKSGASATEIFAAFQGQLGSFTGAMEAQAGTWVGLTSTIRDQLGLLSAQALRPMFDVAKEALGELVNFFNSPAVQSGIEDFSVRLGNTTERMVEFVRTAVIPFVQQHGPRMIQILKTLAVAVAALYIFSIVNGLIVTMTGVMAAATAAGGGLAGVLVVLGGPVTIAVAAVVAVLGLLAAVLVTNKDAMQELEDAAEGLRRARGFADELTQAHRDGAIALREYIELQGMLMKGDFLGVKGEVLIAGSMSLLDMYKQLKTALDAGVISQATYNRMVEDAKYHYNDVENELNRYNAQLRNGVGITGTFNQVTEETVEQVDEVVTNTDAMTNALRYYVTINGYATASSEASAMALALQANELARTTGEAERAAAALQKLKESFNSVSADYMTELPGGDQPLVTPGATVSVTTGGLTQEQSALMAEYGDLAKRAADEIYNLTNGIGTFGMEQEKVNEKLADAQAELSYYQGLMAPLQGVVGDVSTAQRDLAVNTDAVYTALYKQAEQAGATPEALVALGLATGIFTDAQAEAALVAMAVNIEVERLGKLIAAGYDVNKAMTDLDTFITKITGGFVPATKEAQENTLAIRTSMIEAAEGIVLPATDLGTNVAEALGTGITDATKAAEDAATGLGQGVIDSAEQVLGVQSPSTVFRTIGNAIVDGAIAGIRDKAGDLSGAIEGVISGAVQWVKDLLGISSPSTVFVTIGEQIAEGLIVGVQNGEDPFLEAIGGVMSKALSIANGFVKEFTRTTLDPLSEMLSLNAENMEPVMDRLRFLYGDSVIDNLASLSPERFAHYLRDMLARAQTSEQATALSDMLTLLEKRNRFEEAYIAQQEKLKQLEEQRAQIDFLNTQLELIKLLSNDDLAMGVLDGLTLGINASAEDLLAVMDAVIKSLVQQVEDELQIASPSKVFENIGGNIMAGLSQGMMGNSDLVDDFFSGLNRNIATLSDAPGSGGRSNSTDNSRRWNNYGTVIIQQGGSSKEDSVLEDLFWSK